jgi:hypothetical protein
MSEAARRMKREEVTLATRLGDIILRGKKSICVVSA